jgi:hypothetical protein
LLDDVDGAGKVASLGLSGGIKLVDRRSDQEAVRKIIDLALRDIRELVDIAVEPDVPTLVGPVRIRRDVEDFGGLRSQVIADTELREYSGTSGKAFEPTGNA